MFAQLAMAKNEQPATGAPPQLDLRPRLVNYAADHFSVLAGGTRPSKPDPFLAEIIAQAVAALIGEDVPMPLAAPEKRTYMTKARKEEKEEAEKPVVAVNTPDAARAWMEAHGMTRIFKTTLPIVSLFLAHPKRWFKAPEIADLLKKERTNVTAQLKNLKRSKLIINEGNTTATRWKLNEELPHV